MRTGGAIGRGGRLWAVLALAAAALAGCETRSSHTVGEPVTYDPRPLRDPTTPREKQYLRCVASDPAMVTPPCRQFGGKDR